MQISSVSFLALYYSSPESSPNLYFLRLKTALAKRTGRPEVMMEGVDDSLGRRRSSRIMEETSGIEEEEEEENIAAAHGHRGRRDEEVDVAASSIPELERQIEKPSKRQLFFRKKSCITHPRCFEKCRWIKTPLLGIILSTGIFVEGLEGSTVTEDGIKHETESLTEAVTSTPSSARVSVMGEF